MRVNIWVVLAILIALLFPPPALGEGRPLAFLKVEKSTCGISLRFELFDEFSEMQRNGRRKRVVLVPQRSPNCGERNVSIGARIARSATGNNTPAYPVIYSISCGAEVAHECAPLVGPSLPMHVNE